MNEVKSTIGNHNAYFPPLMISMIKPDRSVDWGSWAPQLVPDRDLKNRRL